MREIIFGICLGLSVVLAALLAAAWPVPGRPVAAVFTAASSSAQMAGAVARAGGSLLRFDETHAVVLSVSDNPHYASELYRAGAWLVIGGTLASLCMNAGRPTDL